MARSASGDHDWRRLATAMLVGGLFACILVCALQASSDRGASNGLSAVLAVAAVVAGAIVVDLSGRFAASISASFIVVMLAAAFLGPVSACLAAALAEIAAASRRRTRLYTFATNLLAAGLPALAIAEV